MRRKTLEPPEMDRLPRVTVTLTDEACWITRHDRTGAPAITYPAAIGEVSNAFNQFGASTGLLPANTLFWSSRAGRLRIGVWLPPARRSIQMQVRKIETLSVPLPGLMFTGEGIEYSVFALRERPTTGREILYAAPLPNVHENGAICAGDVKFPVAGPETMMQAVELFFESLFNSDLTGEKIRSGELLPFLRKLGRARQFPSDQLVATNVTVQEFISGSRAQSEIATDGVWRDDDPHAPDYADGIDPYELAYGPTGDEDDEDL